VLFEVGDWEAGTRLDEFLASRLSGLSRMRIGTLLDQGACCVNQTPAPAGYHIARGDRIEVAFDEALPTAMTPEAIPLEIIHEDEHIIVLVKPAGMLVHPTMSVKTGTLLNGLAYHLNLSRMPEREPSESTKPDIEFSNPLSTVESPETIIRPGLVHRLDRATSGLMVIAKTQRALSTLSRHFHKRKVEKRYLALVRGVIVEESCEITAPIGRDPDSRPRWRVLEGGREAQTRLEVRARYPETTLVELEPVTGRTNQLRIHCAHLGHPIVGDEMYDGGPGELTGELKSERARLCLHAWRLGFHHPASGTWMEFNSDASPEEFRGRDHVYSERAGSQGSSVGGC
jgi:23S rRNA pseudouridine1911/1915/1917 synthase